MIWTTTSKPASSQNERIDCASRAAPGPDSVSISPIRGLGKCRPRCWTTNATERRVIALRAPDGVRQDLAAHLVTICAVLQSRLGRDFSQ
jgi:hypothetical protein